MKTKQRNTRTVLQKLGAVLLTLALVLSLSITALAYVRIDTNASASLTVNYTGDRGTAIAGVEFDLYKVADVSDAVELTLSGAFADAAVDLWGVDSASGWNTLAVTLQSYAAANNIAPTATGVTDGDGKIVFSDLSVGLYLLVGESKIIGDYLYTPSPSMVLLPTLNEATDEWEYDSSVNVKYETEQLQEYTEITVKKIWDDNDYSGRPKSITVELLRDGEVIEAVELNDANGWKYTWTDLPVVKDLETGEAYSYTVSEAGVPDGYTFKIEQSGNVYKITNFYEEPEPEPTPSPDEPSNPDNPTPSPDNPTPSPDNPSNPSNPSSPTLPQTGQLVWPIPFLVIGGLLLIVVGVFLKRRRNGA